MGDTPLDFGTSQAVPETMPLDDGVQTPPPMTVDRAQRVAFNTVFGQKDQADPKRTYDQVYAMLTSGQEETLRNEIAAKKDAQNATRAQQIVTDLLGKTVSPVPADPAEVQLALLTAQGKKTDPSTVVEKDYGYQYVSQLDRTASAYPFTLYSQFVQADPSTAVQTKELNSTMVAQRQIALDVLEKAKKRVEDQPWGLSDWMSIINPGYAAVNIGKSLLGVDRGPDQGFGGRLADYAKSANPIYGDMTFRGLINKRWFNNFGSNLLQTEVENIATELNSNMDLEDYKEKAHEVVETLGNKNPMAAVTFAEALVGNSTSTVRLNNALNAVDLLSAGQILEVGVRGLYKAGRGLLEARELRRMARDTVRSSESTETPAVAMAQGAGDTVEAGVQKATELLMQDDVQKAADALPSHLKTNRIFITTDRAPMPPQSGMVRYFFGGDPASAEKTVTKSFDEATNFGGSEHGVQYIDVPEGSAKANSFKLTAEQHDKLQPFEIRPAHSANYRELATRLVDVSSEFGDKMTKAILEMVRVERIPALLKVKSAMQAVATDMKNYFPSLSNHIIDVTPPVKSPAGNWYEFSYHIGQNGGAHFNFRNEAEEFGRLRLGNIPHTVEGEGSTWYIKITKPLNLNSDIVRDGLLASESALSPVRGPKKSYFSWLRTPDEIISEEHRLNRKAAVYSAAIYNELVKSQAQEIQKVLRGGVSIDPVTGEISRANKKVFVEQWNRVVSAAKDFTNPETGKPGRWFRNIGEIEEFYHNTFQRAPEPIEIKAYFAQKNLSDFDHALRNWRVVTNMKQNGVQQFRVHALTADGKDLVSSPWFDGAQVHKLPTGDETIINVADHLEDSKVGILNKGGPTFTNNARKELASGEKVLIRLWQTEKMPFSQYIDDPAAAHATYVLVPAARHEVKDIALEQVPYQEGGHFVYDAEHYIKQANVIKEKVGSVFRRRYLGDVTVMPIKIRAMGEDIAKKLDTFREVYKNQGSEQAKAYLAQNPIGVDYDEVMGWFKPKKDPSTGLVHPPMLSKDERIQVIRRNENIWDKTDELRQNFPKGKPGEIEDSRHSSMSSMYNVEFTGQRDAYGLKTIVNEGTASSPLYKYVPAEYMDPIPVLNRSLRRIINSTFLDDYKMFAVEHWLQEAMRAGPGGTSVMKEGQQRVRSAPFYFFHQGEFKPDAPKDITDRLEAQRQAIKQLLGQESSWSRSVQQSYDDLTDAIYRGEGLKGKLVPQWLADGMLPITKDPLAYLRTVTFHAKLGLFAVPQFLVQSASYVNMYAIAGLRPATMGSVAATFRVWDLINPAMRATLDRKLSGLRIPGVDDKFWWRPGEFTEATELLERSGFGHVQGEHSFINDQLSTNIIKSEGQEFLDAGLWFFRMGEKNTRHGAWYIAYKEFRAKNPTGKITDADLRSILDRADLLSGNMSRASASYLHTGVLAATSQFMAYQIRMAEQITGTRLTGAERIRLAGVNAAIYGIPAAGGLTGLPILGDAIRKWQINNGYVPGNHWYSTLVMEGIPAYLGFLATGTVFNFGNRFGNWGFEPLREAFRTDPSILKIVGGAPLGFVASALGRFDPFLKASSAFMSGKEFHLEQAHVADITNDLAGVSNIRRTLIGLNTGKYLSANGLFLDDTSSTKSLIMGLTGLRDQRIDDQLQYRGLYEDMEKLQKDATRGYVREYQRYLQALIDKQPDLAKEYQANAKYYAIASGLPPDRELAVFKQAVNANKSLIDKVDWQFYGNPKNVPSDKKTLFAKTYREIQEMRAAAGKTHN